MAVSICGASRSRSSWKSSYSLCVRGPVDVAAGRALLVRSEQQSAVFLAHVPARIGLAQHAHFGKALGLALLDQRMRLGDDVLVLDRDHRNIETHHGAGLAREVAGAGDHVFAGDVALVGRHPPFAIHRLRDAGDRGVAIDLGAARARTLGQRLGQVGRLDIAVVGMLDGADDAVGFAQRPDFLQLCGRQLVDLDADGLGHAGVIHELVPAVRGAGEADVGAFLEAHMLAGLGFELAIELDRVFVNLADRIGHVEQRQQARRMPGGAGGQLLALDEDDIAPALLGQVVERRNADDAAADHHHARL